MTLTVLPTELGIARLGPEDPIPTWVTRGTFSSITRTADELSIVCEIDVIPGDVRAERGWRGLQVAGTLDFSLTGILASLAAPLAAARVSIFAISTFDTDYILVRTEALDQAVDCLRRAGHDVTNHAGIVTHSGSD
jgi:hypothetical protein